MRSGRVAGGLVLVAIGVLLLLEQAGVSIPRGVVLSAALICIGIALLVQAGRPASQFLVVGGVVLVVILAFDGRPAGPLRVDLPDAGPRRTVSDSLRIDAPADEIVLDVEAASVTVTGSDGPVAVDWSATYRGRRPTVTSRLEDGTIEVDADCPGRLGLLGGDCRMDVDVRVPAEMDVRIDAGSGHVSVSGIDGDVGAETGSGTVTLTDVGGAVEVDTGSGSVTGLDLRGSEATIETGSGPVRLAFTGSAPAAVDVSTGSGDVSVEIPRAPYRIETDTASGREMVEGITEDPDAPRSITVETGSGSISIVGRGSPPSPAAS